jgi:serine/threonine protein kinase
MALTPGTRLGPYLIEEMLGAGGMGEVYRATDMHLKRAIAIKVLPTSVSGDVERLARFQREAEVLAALNHSNVEQIHGLEKSDAITALVMELVDGPTLAERIAKGPIPLDEALDIAKQIADALQAAHERGIIDRDLKPLNIKLRTDGTVKVLDFGLAKSLDPMSGPQSSTHSPTITSPATMTGVGVLLGTAAYMAPEQAKGGPVDRRADIWAFGCVLYEMLTGRRAFPGATTSETIARLLEREPDWEALPASAPASLRRLLTRSLEKDPKRRLHDIADAKFEIEEAQVESTSRPAIRDSAPRAGIRRGPIVVTVVVAMALLALAVWRFFPRSGPALPPPRVTVLTSYPGIEARPTFSPDGSQVAFSWDGEAQDNEDIYVVIVGSDSPLRLTTSPARDVSPAWKPDGSEVAFARLEGARAVIYVVSPLGQSERKLAEFSALPVRTGPRDMNDPLLSWSPDGRWLAVSHKTAGPQQGIFLLAHDGSAQRLLVARRTTEGYVPAAFSPKWNHAGLR